MKHSIISLGQKLRYVFVATADRKAMPHIALAGEITEISDARLAVSAWFCPGTLNNLEQNRLVSLVVWDPATDDGYQILGNVEEMAEEVMMNGHSPELEKKGPVPQVKWKLVVHVEKILSFTRAPHSDMPV